MATALRRRLRRILMTLPIPLLAVAPPFARVQAKAATTREAPPASRDERGGATTGRISLARVAQRLLHRTPLRIVAFGSSSTEGVGASTLAATYPSRLRSELAALLPHEDIDVINRGVGGEDAEDLARRVDVVLADQPDLVIFQTGTNDPLRDVPLERFVALTRWTVAAMQRARIDVMLMEPQFCRVTRATPAAALYRDAVRAVGAEMRVPVIRRWDLMRGWLDHDLLDAAQMLSPDGLHMADAGYAMLAKAVAGQIIAASAPPAATAAVTHGS